MTNGYSCPAMHSQRIIHLGASLQEHPQNRDGHEGIRPGTMATLSRWWEILLYERRYSDGLNFGLRLAVTRNAL
jgi:hypothetical protein